MTKSNKQEVKKSIGAEINDFIHLLDMFGDLLENETQALENFDLKTVDQIQNKKHTFTARHTQCVQKLQERRSEFINLDQTLKTKIIHKRTTFTKILERNLLALDLMKKSAGRLTDRILDLARRAVVDQNQTTYSSRGKTESWESATSSLQMDEVL